MRNIIHFNKKLLGKMLLLLAMSLLTLGCQKGNDPISAQKNIEAENNAAQNVQRQVQNVTKSKSKIISEKSDLKQKKRAKPSLKYDNSVTVLTEKNNIKNTVSDTNNNITKLNQPVVRDPFTIPESLQTQQPFTPEQLRTATMQISLQSKQPALQNKVVGQNVLCDSPNPDLAGIFDNGKEKLVLIHWQQVQGIFRKNEALGNGYYVKEITPNSVLLSPEKNCSDTTPITLALLH